MSSREGNRSPLTPQEAARLVAPNIDNVGRARPVDFSTHISTASHMTRGTAFSPMTMNPNTPGAYTGSHMVGAGDNIQDRFELFLLGEGEKKVTEEPDTRIPSSSIFTFNKEDHTLGNLLSSRLLQSPHVTFSGYKVPHPLVAQFILRIQTDGTITPRQALMLSCKDLVSDLSILSREFTKEWELRKMVGDAVQADGKPNGR